MGGSVLVTIPYGRRGTWPMMKTTNENDADADDGDLLNIDFG